MSYVITNKINLIVLVTKQWNTKAQWRLLYLPICQCSLSLVKKKGNYVIYNYQFDGVLVTKQENMKGPMMPFIFTSLVVFLVSKQNKKD